MTTRHTQLQEFLARARGTAASARVQSLDDLAARRPGGGSGGASGASGQVLAFAQALDRDSEPETAVEPEPWGLEALRGRLVELSARGASATLTAAVALVHEAQRAGEPVAWILRGSGTFYPPDVADNGVDLAALVVIRTTSALSAARSAEQLLRSGAFGLIVIDLESGNDRGLSDSSASSSSSSTSSSSSMTARDRSAAHDPGGEQLSMAHQGRLVTLAQANDAAIVCITQKSADVGSLGSLISLRVEALRHRLVPPQGGFEISMRALKDKRRGPGWIRTRRARGPAGL